MSEPDEEPAWWGDAACAGADPALFFPTQGDNCGEAKAICATCPVTAECLEYAMAMGSAVEGVWGGTSARERRQIRRKRAVARGTRGRS